MINEEQMKVFLYQSKREQLIFNFFWELGTELDLFQFHVRSNTFIASFLSILMHKNYSIQLQLQKILHLQMFQFRIFPMQRMRLATPQHLQNIQPEFKSIKLTEDYSQPFQSTTIQSSAFYRLIYKYPFYFKSNSERNFINQLIISLQFSAHFQYLVHLTPLSSSFLGSLKETHKLACAYLITYCSIIKIDQVQQIRIKVQNQFKEKCSKMNAILNAFKDKYRLETRLSFWVKRFNDLLKQCQQKQIKENKKVGIKQKSLFEDGSNLLEEQIQL